MCSSVLGSKGKLVNEHAVLARELKESVQKEMELEETIKNLRYVLFSH